MDYRFLGSTGVRVSSLCLGALAFGRELDEAASHCIIGRYLEAGGNFIDTADSYGDGRSEEIVGRAIRDCREQIVLATKVGWQVGDRPDDVGLSRRRIIRSLEGSLRRLRTDHVDVYYLHCWDAAADIERVVRVMGELVRAGEVRYWGVSNFTGWQIAHTMAIARRSGCAVPVAVQPQYSLMVRNIEREVLPAAQWFDLAVVAWSPLARGMLADRFRSGEAPLEHSRIGCSRFWIDDWRRWDRERHWCVLETVRDLAAERERTSAQIALNWLLQQPGVTAPVLGVTKLSQLEENLGALGWELTAEELERLEEASAFATGYPYEFMNRWEEVR